MAYIQKREKQNGKHHYRVQVRLKGFPTQSATFERKTDANKWAMQTESAIREGRHFATVESKKHTLAKAIDRYIKEILPTKPKSAAKQKSQLMWWRDRIGAYTLSDASPQLIAEHRDLSMKVKTNRGGTRSPSTTIRYLAVISHLFTVAIKEWNWIDNNPVLRIMKPKEPKGRTRFLADEERTQLLDACKRSESPYLYQVVVLALSTGMRQGEIMNLKWKDVDFKKKRITLWETKNNEIRVVPLTGLAFDLIENHSKIRKLKVDFLFPGLNSTKPIDLRKPWLAALNECNIKNFRFHDLRHSAASYLLMNGASLPEIAGVLGHKTFQMVQRYAHLSEPHTAGVVTSMNEKIFGSIR